MQPFCRWFVLDIKRLRVPVTMARVDLRLEEKLVEKAKHDPEAFGRIYEQYYPRIFNYILKRVADVQLALDITSTTFFKALDQIQHFQWRNIPFSSWLYRVASNEICNHFRKEKHSVVSLNYFGQIADDDDYLAEVSEAEEKLRRHGEYLLLHKRLSELPARYQEVIILRFFEKKKIREIAEILGKKEGTIKSLLHRGLEKLREMMKNDATF